MDDPRVPPGSGAPLEPPTRAGEVKPPFLPLRLLPEEGLALMQAVTAQSRIVEVAEIERRIAALEEAAKRKGQA